MPFTSPLPAVNSIIYGDCLLEMPKMDSNSVDCVMSDLPYGTTYASWDSVLSLDVLWKEWKRILKPGGAIVLTASQPFTSVLVTSNLKWFRCEWIWDKVIGANFANANRQPLKTHESVLVFCEKQPTYHPQKTSGPKNHSSGNSTVNTTETRLMNKRTPNDLSGMKFPKTIQTFPKYSSQCGLHPTQKPVALMEYLIRTYTNPSDVILDPCCGSGTTLLAAHNEDRNYIGIEKEEKYFVVSRERLCVL